MTRVLLATDSEAFERRVAALLGDAAQVRRLPAVALGERPLTEAMGDHPAVVMLGPGVDVGAALEVSRRIDEWHPETTIALVTPLQPDLWQRALRAGVRDVVAPDATDDELAEVLERATRTWARRRANLSSEAAGGLVGGDGLASRIIAVVSPKGGSGKTTVAANLAVALARAVPSRGPSDGPPWGVPEPPAGVVVVDADLQFGDVPSALGIHPEQTMADVLPGATGAVALKAALARHGSGAYVLAAPDSPAAGEELPPAAVANAVRHLATAFRFVVVDTPAGLNEATLALLDVATDMVMVASMDVPSVRQLRKELDAFDAIGLVLARRHFVLNRSDSRVGLTLKDVQRVVRLPVTAALPSSRSVPLSLNAGTPIVQSEPRSAVARAILALAGQFADVGGKQRRRRG
jgi:pilus assembly protein CpaE